MNMVLLVSFMTVPMLLRSNHYLLNVCGITNISFTQLYAFQSFPEVHIAAMELVFPFN